jgi:CubicO group peptidase (beta-lactamase class C family)
MSAVRWFPATLCALIVAVPAHAQSPAIPDTLDRYIEGEMRERQIPGLALAIVRNGEIIRQRGYGMADVQNDVPVTPNTRFELASITKQFTAAAVIMLVEEGKIDLDTSVTHYLPDAPAGWVDITVRHLLTHTSGLPPMGEGFSGSVGRIYNRVAISGTDGYDAARADTLRTPPGERFAYSDVGYYLLGFITQLVSGTPWREFIRERIFEPLGMTDSFISDQFGVHRNLARGYTLRDGTLINLHRPWQFEVPSHGIGVFSTVGDLARWDAALYTDSPLSDASRREAWTPVRLNDGSTHPYGFGWQVQHPNGHLLLRHTGVTGTEIVRLPDDTITVIVLTNLGRGYGGTVRSWGIARAIAEMLVPGIRGTADETAMRRGNAGSTLSSVSPLCGLPPRSVSAGSFPSAATHSRSLLSGGE